MDYFYTVVINFLKFSQDRQVSFNIFWKGLWIQNNLMASK